MYSGTLASVQAAQQRAQTASARSAAKEQDKLQKQALQMEKELQGAKTRTINTTSKLSDAYRNQGNIISNLKGLASQYISIYAAGRIVQNLTEITGMFELQEKSLEAIIRNKQQADKIFSQTKTLAIESPFQFKDLIGYVKQLAAYRVETDQLYDTMKNLADVSAGLGVDMNRIILAYGQVKSAAVLRGQELRQFTEAGIPLVQELAKKFSEVEKRAVSMNEVFSLISARQVPFEMIRDIFADMTSEGGMFFNMQKIQAETLAGKISNLKDAFDIMFNSIGSSKEVNFVLKGTVDLIMSMAKNWKIVSAVIIPLIGSFGLYRVTMAGVVAIENIRMKQSASMASLYKGELLAISRKDAALRASIASSRALVLQETLSNALQSEGISKMKAWTIANSQRIAMEKSGMDIGKVTLAQEALKNTLMQKGVTETRAAEIANKSYQAAVMGANVGLSKFKTTLKALYLSNPVGWWMLGIGAVISFVGVISNAISAANKLKKELASIDNAGTAEEGELLKRYSVLRNTILNGTSTENDKAKAMETLKNKYSEIIPAIQLTAEYIQHESESYNNARKAISEYIKEKTKEKKISAINEDYTTKSDKYMTGMQKSLVKLGADAESAAIYVEELQRKFIELDISNYQDGLKTANSLMRSMFGYDMNTAQSFNTDAVYAFQEQYKKFYYKTKEYNEGIQKALKGSATYYQENSKEYKKMINDIQDAKLRFKKENDLSPNKVVGYKFDRENAKIEQEFLIKYLRETIKVSKIKMKKAVREQDFSNIQSLILDNFGKGLAGKIQSLYADPFTDEINNYLSSNGVKDIRYQKKENQTPDDYEGIMEAQKNVAEKKLKELSRLDKKIIAEKKGFIDAIGQWQKKGYEEEKAYWENELKAPKLYAEKYGKDWFTKAEKPTNTGSRDNTDYVLERYKREIEMMEKAKETYDDLVQSGYTAADAMSKTMKLYSNKIGDYVVADTPEKMVENYNAAIKKLKTRPKTGDDIFSIEKNILDVNKNQLKKTIEEIIDQINKDFDNSKKRINIFDKLFETSGDYGLASNIAQDLYGKGGVQIKTALREAVKSSLEGTNIKMSDIVDANDDIDLNKAFEAANKLKDNKFKASLLENLNAVREYKEKEIEEFYKGFEAFQSYEKRKSDVVMKEMKYRYDISKSTLPDSEKARLTSASENREKEGISKIDLEQFKESDTWLRAFGDLDKLSIESIKRLKNTIKEYLDTYRSGMSATDIKTISDKIIELDDATKHIDLKETLKKVFTKIDLTPFEESVAQAKNNVTLLEAEVRILQQKKTEADAAVKDKDGKDNSAEMDAQAFAATQLAEALERLDKAKKALGISEDKLNNAGNQQREGLEELDGEVKNLSDYMNKLQGAIDGVVGTFKDSADAMGFKIGDETLAVIDGINAGLTATITIIGAVAAAIAIASSTIGKALLANPILLAISAGVALLVGIVSTLNKLSLAKYNDEIKKHDLLIKGLEREYKNLDIEIEKLSGNDYIKGLKEQYAIVIEQMIEAQKKLEAARKKNKREEMETFQDEIDEKRRQAQELKDELAQTMLGSDIASAANSFADAWFEAYLSFADTAQAIKGEFKDMMKNMVINAMLTNVINTALVPVYKMIDDLSKDGYTADEVKQIYSLMLSIAPGLDEALKATISGVSSIMGDLYDKTENLSGLSKGIAGASEETVGILAGYMDSIRFRLFAYIDFMMANGQGNTMSSLMQAQTTQIIHLANIDANTLRSAIANEDLTKEVKKLISVSGSKGSYALNVNI